VFDIVIRPYLRIPLREQLPAMPLLLKQRLPGEGLFGLWQILESEDELLGDLDLTVEEKARFDTLNGRKRTEWLAARKLLHILSERKLRGSVIKDEYGKPFLAGSSWDISISHSHGLAAVAAAPTPIGIDVQKLTPNITRIAERYLSPGEMAAIRYRHRLDYLHIYWCAKEAMYKAYGKKGLSFRLHLQVHPFTFNPRGGHAEGRLEKETHSMAFDLYYVTIGSHYLVVARSRNHTSG